MDDDNKNTNKFWVAALAFSILLLATTFALLATYLSEIKDNTQVALSRSEIVAQRLNTLDMELLALQRHIMENKAAIAAATVSAPAVQSGAAPVSGIAMPASSPETPGATVPAIQTPSMTAPEAAPTSAKP